MYQERVSPKVGKISNMVIMVLAVIAIFVFEPLAVLLRDFAMPLVTICQTFFIVGLVVFCIWFYKKRLCSVRYTFITESTEFFSDLEEKPEEFSELEEGTLLAECFVGEGEGNYVAVIKKSEMRAFYSMGESIELPKHCVKVNAMIGSKKEAAALIFEQEGDNVVLYFTPGKELENALKDCVGHGIN